MTFRVRLRERNVSDDVLLDDLRRVARELGRITVTIEEYNSQGRFHATTLQRRFRSWFKALEGAGLSASRSELNIDDDTLLGNLRDVWVKLARQPNYGEVKKPLSKYSSGTYANRFGSWSQALLAFERWAAEEGDAEQRESDEAIEPLDLDQASVAEASRKRSRANPREPSERLRFAVLLRDGFACQSCGRSPLKERDVELHVDHLVPYSRGGRTEKSNLATRCSRCNLGKGAAFDG